MGYRVSIILILIGMLAGVLNMIFFGYYIIYIVATGCLFIAAGLVLSDKKKQNGYKNNWELLKGEYDVFILMGGVVLFGIKFLVPEPLKSSLHLLSLSTIFLVLGFGRYKKPKKVDK